MRRAIQLLMILGVVVGTTTAATASAQVPASASTLQEAAADSTLPLLRWDLLGRTVYDPRRPIAWSPQIEALNGQMVRMEGYLMLRYDSQDPADLFLTGINPLQLFCGPTDMTQIAEMYLPGFRLDDWQSLPVEVTGIFRLSRNTADLRPIFLLQGRRWRPLKRWEQEFPGAYPQESREQEDTTDR